MEEKVTFEGKQISDARKGGLTQAKAYILQNHLASEKRKSLISSQGIKDEQAK